MATTAAVIGVLGSLAGTALEGYMANKDKDKQGGGGGSVIPGGRMGMGQSPMYSSMMQLPMGTPGFGGGYPMGSMMGGGGGGGADISGLLNILGMFGGGGGGGGGGAGAGLGAFTGGMF